MVFLLCFLQEKWANHLLLVPGDAEYFPVHRLAQQPELEISNCSSGRLDHCLFVYGQRN